MNKANLKAYAPQARLDFIAAVTSRANLLGISAKGSSSVDLRGDIAIIEGREWPVSILGAREKLLALVKRHGFEHSMEEVAYTWFNRFAALRYMEIHDYLDHGWRVLSSRNSGLPEILAHASEVSLPGLNVERAQEMQMLGNRDSELYRMMLVAQCNALSRVMPFLFERIDDLTELLLPDNLLRTDSIVAKLVAGVPEEDWQEIEAIGWLYQFYISDKKDQVIGKVIKSEDIPAATQLFTPNWIVQYLVQNSVGRLWLMANPHSALSKEWPYYIPPAEQSPEVQAQLDALILTRVSEDGVTLNPESITVLDPACGSGHILVVAYDVLKAIYLERGYQARAIPRLILEKNLFGLDIDDRAAQMAGFALLMKARADDRRLFTATDDAGNLQPPKLNVLSLQESKGLSVDELATHLSPFKVQRATITGLLDAFEHAKTFGSLIQIPYVLKTQLALLPEILTLVQKEGDMYASAAAADLLPLVQQAQMLSMQFDAVVANPPYMGNKYFSPLLKTYLKENYKSFEKDIFSAFMIRNLTLTKISGNLGFMSPFVWMFISSYEDLRTHFINEATITSLVQLEYSGFDGAVVPICTFTLFKAHVSMFSSSYIRLSDFRGADQQGPKTLEAIQNQHCGWFYTAKANDFSKIPGSPIAYWINRNFVETIKSAKQLENFASPKKGMITLDDARFTRKWFEIDFKSLKIDSINSEDALKSSATWVPITKGGGFRKWSGCDDSVVNWKNDGKEIKDHIVEKYRGGSYSKEVRSESFYFRPAISWGLVTSSKPSFRQYPPGFIIGNAGPCMYLKDNSAFVLALLNSCVAEFVLKIMCPTINFAPGDLARFPVPQITHIEEIDEITKDLVDIHTDDWNEDETSWGFSACIFVKRLTKNTKLSDSFIAHSTHVESRIGKVQLLEQKINTIFIDAYGLQVELRPEVQESQVTLARANREKDSQRLISYALGCMMGRYSLDEPGLIYAHAGNIGFDASRYASFPADADGIVPITDEAWFPDDAGTRIREFSRVVWGADTLEENMAWLAESLGQKSSETPDETVRRYLSDKFYKDHMQTYKKRPIYWQFSSGKQGAFQALVYLHRYSEGTLARMRTEYVVPLTSKIAYRLEMLEKDATASGSAAARTKIQKQIESLRKKQTELLAYDEKLRHYADMRIALDLDDGVKANYAKFGDLVSDAKAITGGSDE